MSANSQITWDAKPDTSQLPASNGTVVDRNAIQWDSQPDTSAVSQPSQSPLSAGIQGYIEKSPLSALSALNPKDHREELVSTVGGTPALVLYRRAKGIVGSVENMIKSAGSDYDTAKLAFQKSVQDFHAGNYGQAATDATAGVATAANRLLSPTSPSAISQVQQAAQRGQDLINPSTPTVRARAIGELLGQATTAGLAVLAPTLAPEADAADAAAGTDAADTATESAPEAQSEPTEQPSDANPSLVQQVLKGDKIIQPKLQVILRKAAGAPNEENIPLVSGQRTAFDAKLSQIRLAESSAYQKMDSVAGFDVKAEKAQLSNDQYKLQQLGNTDADQAAREKLQDSIADSQARIMDAEQKMSDAGIDPKAADRLHQSRMAAMDVKKSLVKNFDASTGNVNVKGLLNDAKNLRLSKYGDRLTQFFGSSDAADAYVTSLQKLYNQGIQAAKVQKIAKLTAKYVAPAGAIGYELVR